MKKIKNLGMIVMTTVLMMMSSSYNDCSSVDLRDPTVLLPDPACCNRFISCSNGVPILMCCPDGLYFNDEWDVCGWPSSSGCIDGRYGVSESCRCGDEKNGNGQDTATSATSCQRRGGTWNMEFGDAGFFTESVYCMYPSKLNTKTGEIKGNYLQYYTYRIIYSVDACISSPEKCCSSSTKYEIDMISRL